MIDIAFLFLALGILAAGWCLSVLIRRVEALEDQVKLLRSR